MVAVRVLWQTVADAQQPNTAATDGLAFTPRLFALAALSGGATGLAAGVLMMLLRFVQHVAFGWTPGLGFQQAAAQASGAQRLGSLLLAALIAISALWIKQGRRFGETSVTKAIWQHAGRMPFLATLIDAVESIVIVGLGVSLGREAALKEAGGALASALSSAVRVSEAERRVLVAIAAGAGMSAAYNLPLGGALLAVEVFLGTFSLPVLFLAVTASSMGTLSSWLLLPNQPTYNTAAFALHGRDLLWAMLAGPLFGLLAHGWVRAVAFARAHRVQSGWMFPVLLLIFVALGAASLREPALLGNGKGLVQMTLASQGLLRTLLLLLVLKWVFTAACVGSGAPGGLFTPTMSLGALAGSVLGRLWAFALPGSDAGLYALIGSAAVLAVSTAGPVSALVMIMELTRHTEILLVPMLLATAGAALTARWLDGEGTPQSIYTV